MEEKEKKKVSTGTWVLVGATVIALGVGAYFFFNREVTGDEGVREDPDDKPTSPPPSAPAPPRYIPSSSGFPIKSGSRGSLVRSLQEALIRAFGSSILPRFGADGDWGSETSGALISKGLPTYITSQVMLDNVISKITKPTSNSSNTPKSQNTSSSPKELTTSKANSIAKNLRWHIRKENFKGVSYFLSLIKSVKDYSNVNAFFKSSDMHDGTKRTIVTGVFRFFSDKYFRELLAKHFYRMGLKKRNGKWSLSGLNNVLFNQIKTINEASIWNDRSQIIKVPFDTILGEYISAKNGITKFKTLDGKTLYVSTDNIRYV